MGKKALAAACAAFVFSIGHVHAGAMTGGSTEVTQIMNNIQLAMQSVQQQSEYATQLRQYYVQLQQLAPDELKGFLMSANELKRAIEDLRSFNGDADAAFGALEDLKNIAQERYDDYQRAGVPWEEYLERERQQNERTHNQRQVLRDHEKHAIERAEQTWKDLEAHGKDAQKTEGVHAAIQVLNGQMNTLIALLNETRVHDTMASRAMNEHYSRINDEKRAELEVRNAAREEALVGHRETQQIIENLRAAGGVR